MDYGGEITVIIFNYYCHMGPGFWKKNVCPLAQNYVNFEKNLSAKVSFLFYGFVGGLSLCRVKMPGLISYMN